MAGETKSTENLIRIRREKCIIIIEAIRFCVARNPNENGDFLWNKLNEQRKTL